MVPNFPVRDLKLKALVELAHHDWIIPKLTGTKFEIVANSMRANAARVRTTMLIPTSIAGYVDEVRIWLDQAEFDVTGESNPPGHKYPQDVMEKIERRFQELHQADRANALAQQGTPQWDEKVYKHHINALHILTPIAKSPLGALGFLHLFSAFITGTWTAIETMTGDLWEIAVNCRPQRLASLNGKPNRIAKGTNANIAISLSGARGDEPKVVPLYLLQMNNFDLREKMGTILRTRFDFARLSGIREAYSCAFSEKSSRIDTALANKSLDAISVLRNALVHKAGCADAEYLRRAPALKLPVPKLGEPILLDGEIVADLVRPAMKAASNLMTAVADWVEQN
jgi:hypothetical protein